jgi:hypothetical protein
VSRNGFLQTAFFLAIASGLAPAVHAQLLQQAKLVGSGAVPSTGVSPGVAQGTSVVLSSDGNTALVGGPQDNALAGAVWVFGRNGAVWSQQGAKLFGSGGASGRGDFPGSKQGSSVAISGDGTTAIIGGPGDSYPVGAAWVFTRTGGVWTPQGAKPVGTGGGGDSAQGVSVAISSGGNTAIVGGKGDSQGVGAVWFFVRSGGV